MPSVSFHLNLETLKLFRSQSSCSQFFIEEDFSLLRLPPHVGRYKLSVRGKVMKFYIYIYFFFFSIKYPYTHFCLMVLFVFSSLLFFIIFLNLFFFFILFKK